LMPRSVLDVETSSFWFKIVDMLQHNWAVILPQENGAEVVFFGDTSYIFDRMNFAKAEDAAKALRRNGFALFDDDKDAQSFIPKPPAQLKDEDIYHRPIYSSGEFWR
jgi:hypothetical protein